MLSARDSTLLRQWIARGPFTSANGTLVVRAVKAYYDGALGSRGAQMLNDYADRPGHRGVSGGAYGFNQQLVADAMSAQVRSAVLARDNSICQICGSATCSGCFAKAWVMTRRRSSRACEERRGCGNPRMPQLLRVRRDPRRGLRGLHGEGSAQSTSRPALSSGPQFVSHTIEARL